MILITGVSGFIGKHLLKKIIKVYDAENVVALTSVPVDDCKYILHNNYSFSESVFVSAGFTEIDTVIHAGAFTPKSGRDGNDIKKSYSNISNTYNLIRSELPALKKFIFLSTIDVYGNSQLINEESLVYPQTLYGNSKYYCERMIESWGVENSICTQVLRIGHVYGPGEEAYLKIIPLTFRKLLRSEKIQIYGEGKEKRSFIYINDIVEAIINCISIDQSIGVVNLAGSEAISIRQLVELMIKVSGTTAEIETIHSESKGVDRVFENAKLKKFLLKSEMSLYHGLLEEWKYLKQLPE